MNINDVIGKQKVYELLIDDRDSFKYKSVSSICGYRIIESSIQYMHNKFYFDNDMEITLKVDSYPINLCFNDKYLFDYVKRRFFKGKDNVWPTKIVIGSSWTLNRDNDDVLETTITSKKQLKFLYPEK
ncbi:hypothetical protein F5ESL0228_00110 [Lactobacillus sp. ESL0228]|nr:hypothetical protein F5ESL0228_00110 [Lactobacillus sp. ESL0228]